MEQQLISNASSWQDLLPLLLPSADDDDTASFDSLWFHNESKHASNKKIGTSTNQNMQCHISKTLSPFYFELMDSCRDQSMSPYRDQNMSVVIRT